MRGDRRAKAPSHGRALRFSHLFIALLAIAVAALAAVFLLSMRQQQDQVAGLQDRLRDLVSQTDLLTAQLAATPPKGSAAAGHKRQATLVSHRTAAPGAERLFVHIVGEKTQRYGWDLTVRPAQYFTGAAAFSLATSKGDLPHHGVYILDDSTTTMTLRLVKATPVTLVGWGQKKGKTAKPTATDLAAVVTGGAAPRSPWKNGWYWLSVRDRVIVAVSQQEVKS